MHVIFKFEFVVETQTSRDEEQSQLTAKQLAVVRERSKQLLKEMGVKVISGVESIRPLSKEERMLLVPLRTHYGDNFPICGRTKTKRISTNWSAVDCKFCHKLRPVSAQRGLGL